MIISKQVFDLVKLGWRKYAGLDIKSILVNSRKMVYLEANPNSKNIIVMLHGITADKYMWPVFARKFVKNGYRVIIPDLPPFGESEYDLSINYSLENQAKNLKIFLENINVNHKIHIMGNSMGGGVSAKFTILYPDLVTSLVLFDNMGIYSVKRTKFLENLESGDKNLMLIKNKSDLNGMLNLVYHKQPFIPPVIKKELLRERKLSYDKDKKVFNDLLSEKWYLEEELDKIKVKTFIIWGKYDEVFDFSTVEVLKMGIENSNSLIVDNCGHMPMNEKAYYTAKKVLKFIKSLN